MTTGLEGLIPEKQFFTGPFIKIKGFNFRKVRIQRRDGNFELGHVDDFIDQLLREERVCDVQLPRYTT